MSAPTAALTSGSWEAHVHLQPHHRFWYNMPSKMYGYSEEYADRLRKAAVGAVALHVGVFFLIGWSFPSVSFGLGAPPRPIVLNLHPPEPLEERQLVEVREAAAEPAEDTNLISDRNSKAQDEADTEGPETAPYVDEVANHAQLARSGAPAREAAPQPETAGPVEPPLRMTETETVTEAAAAGLEPDLPDPPRKEAAPFEVAKVDQPSLSETMPQPARGTVKGGVSRKGPLAFEAKQHELGAYLTKIQHGVEARWQSMLRLRYKGTSATEAVLECAINPDGTLAYVKIVDSGDSVSYAPLCKEAIERAAPFGPFPFEVPEVYRTQTLEIHWTFSFL